MQRVYYGSTLLSGLHVHNILSPGQTIATLLGATCCVRLATVLRCVATCWVLLAQI